MTIPLANNTIIPAKNYQKANTSTLYGFPRAMTKAANILFSSICTAEAEADITPTRANGI